MKKMSRRHAVQLLAATGAAVTALPRLLGQAASEPATQAKPMTRPTPPGPAIITPPAGFGVARGPFEPTMDSLSKYEVPEWYRDAKFGIWAHWGPQCQPEMGDWYAQRMYQFNNDAYRFHVQKYGHPSKFGFKDVCNVWKAEKWDPVALIALYKKAGAKFFAAMANHHDNMDMFDSAYQPWNSVKIGPKKDIVGGWAKAARDAGLRLAVSSHAGRAWSWYNVSQGSDPSGPMAGVQYDGTMTKDMGKGLWWEGLDPQDLYAQYHPAGGRGGARGPASTTASGPAGGATTRGPGGRGGNVGDAAYTEKYFNRIVDLINKYDPDILYFDDSVFPLYPATDVGPRIAAYLYNKSIERHGKLEAVMTGKGLNATQRKAILLDLERAVTGGSDPIPWQTDTCIGDWHYRRSLFDQHRYKTAIQVVQMLIDIVSKNGNLMLNIPLPGNGLPDEDEMKVLAGLASWMPTNGEALYGTRPWAVYGEGPSTTAPARRGMGSDFRAYTAEDVRFTKKGDILFAILMGWPDNGKATIKSLAEGAANFPRKVAKVELLGSGEVKFTRDASGLVATMPQEKPHDFAYALKVTPA
jgi:alpha-L-fucosidase